jgi:general stress protein 26
MPRVERFAEIADEFRERVERIVWATVTTVDGRGRPFSRILHPIWEGETGWIITGRQSPKARHLSANPAVAVSYWDPAHDTVIAQCRAEWCDDADTKLRIWNLFKDTPPPLGYDPAAFLPGGPTDLGYGLLKLTLARVDCWTLAALMQGESPRTWIR